MLEASNLGKSFGSLVALQDVSFSVPAGICFGLLGPNGAGKTTAISIITGTLDADAGSVAVDGVEVAPANHQSRRNIGYVPQELAVYDEISSIENLRFFAALYGLKGDEATKRIEYALEVVGLTDRAKEPVKGFSGGMKRRLNIAVAMVHRPKLLVLDEPTVGVDPQSRNAIFDVLLRLQREGMTILYTTHYMEEVEKLCQRVAVMDSGRIIAEDTLAGLKLLLPAKNEVTITLHEPATALPGWSFPTSIIDGSLRIEIDDLEGDLAEILRVAKRDNLQVAGVQTREASLEEVFLHVTGKRLRD